MPTTFDCVAPERTLNRQFRILEALRDGGRNGGGSGKWMSTTLDCEANSMCIKTETIVSGARFGAKNCDAGASQNRQT